MSVNKKSISSQALKEMDEIKNAIKEESKNTIKAMLSEAVKDAIRQSIDDDDDDMEILDDDKECCPECGKCGDECKCDKKDAKGKDDKKSEKKDSGELDEVGDEEEVPADAQAAQDPAMNAQAQAAQGPAMNAQAQAPAQGDGAEGQDDFMAQYQAGDEDTLDLTGEQDIQNVLKVYRALSDDDQVVVKQDGGKISLQDNGTGAEYIIDLGTDEAGAEAEPAMEDGEAEQLAEEFDLDGEDEDNEDLNQDEMKNEETLFEIDLGYTDNYQDKDPIAGLSNSEPSKSGRSWHKGIPTGTEKPWAGKGTEKKGDPFDNSVNENFTELDDDYFAAGLNDTGVAEVETEDGMPFDKKVDEATNAGGYVQQNSTSKSHAYNNRPHTPRSGSEDGARKKGTVTPRYSGSEDESVNEAIKKLKAKNKKLNEAVKELHKGLKEAYMTNVNLGKITKLFLESTTTQAEKLQIVERFSNEAKTPKQAQALYESISKELVKKTTVDESKVTEKTVVAESKAPVYKSQDLLNTIDLMNRVLNC
jgi:hypothetical protein